MAGVRFVAEISGNHAQNLENALQLIREAKKLQAEVKFQCFHPEKLANARAAGHLGEQYSYDQLKKIYLKTYTPSSWWPSIKKELADWPWSCSVFSEEDLEFMEYIRCPRYKIASFELQNLGLIKAVARKCKPIVVSVNDTHKREDVLNAWDTIIPHHRNVTFLYATPYDKFDIMEAYAGAVWLSGEAPPQAHLGLSDHSPPGDTKLGRMCAESWLVNMIERHLALPGVKTADSQFSDTPEQFEAYMGKISVYANNSTLTD